ncbi:hypothetical protein [Streptomyces sp. L2]|uniref:hypothetical protein n=1 Tax=Streptomyces sp. L2 TaxID=2162665 RepID=UPI0010120477|nr:hypothetical protein [Streptomyces sp. L2]
MFVASALATLVAGAVIEPSSEDIRLTMPASTKLGDYQLAISDICGGNAFLPGLFLVATTISGKPVMPATRDKRHLSATRTSDHPVSLKAQT